MADREKVMSWLEGLAEPDWRDFHSDSEVQNIAKFSLVLLKELNAVVRCKDCAYALYNESIQQGHIVCTKPFTERWQVVKPNDWYCADWKCKEKTNCSEYPNGSHEGR